MVSYLTEQVVRVSSAPHRGIYKTADGMGHPHCNLSSGQVTPAPRGEGRNPYFVGSEAYQMTP